MGRLLSDALAGAETPPVVTLEKNLFAVCFELMKLLPARFIVDSAIESGRLAPGGGILESTSGTFGLGLAATGALRGYPVTLVGDPAIDDHLRRRLSALGARVHIVDTPSAGGNYQQARLDKLEELRDGLGDVFVPGQYDNPLNPLAYSAFAEHLLSVLGQFDVLVGTVGSGGSMCGTTSFLRTVLPDLWVVGVDTHRSVLFGQEDGPRRLRGLGNSVDPGNLDHTVFDEVHWLGDAEAFHSTHLLHRRHTLFMGPTSGAAYHVARRIAATRPDARVVALCADGGHRYQSTFNDEEWLRRNDLYVDRTPEAPVLVQGPDEAISRWDHMMWGRRSLADVTGSGKRVRSGGAHA